jgi:hypothetical protein
MSEMIGEWYDCEEPVCPHCKSEKWIAYYKPVDFTHEEEFVIVNFECVCEDCGKVFHERRYYRDTDTPEYFPIEKSE